MIRKAIVSSVLAASLVIGGGVVAYTQQGCTKAQGVILESGIPTDVQTIWCVINTATSSGGSLEAVAQQCGANVRLLDTNRVCAGVQHGKLVTNRTRERCF